MASEETVDSNYLIGKTINEDGNSFYEFQESERTRKIAPPINSDAKQDLDEKQSSETSESTESEESTESKAVAEPNADRVRSTWNNLKIAWVLLVVAIAAGVVWLALQNSSDSNKKK